MYYGGEYVEIKPSVVSTGTTTEPFFITTPSVPIRR